MGSIYDSMFSGADAVSTKKAKKATKKAEGLKKEAEYKVAFLKDSYEKDSTKKEGITYEEWLKTKNGLDAQIQYKNQDSKFKRFLNTAKKNVALASEVVQERKLGEKLEEESSNSSEGGKSKFSKFGFIAVGSLILIAGGIVAYVKLNGGGKGKGKIK